jgi:hypothetical protein
VLALQTGFDRDETAAILTGSSCICVIGVTGET